MAGNAARGQKPGGLKYPADWSKMTQQQRRQWEEANRPGYSSAARAAAPPAEAQTLGPQLPQPHQGEQGAASEYNTGLQSRRAQEAEDEYQHQDDPNPDTAAQEIDARKMLGRILRAMAEEFDPGS